MTPSIQASLSSLITKLAMQRVMVIGDIILDEYVIGAAQRLSREAPIPVLELIERRYIPGGAANPASGIVALGSHALQVGVVGDDESAAHLQTALHERGINTDGIFVCSDRPTTLKTRIMAQMGLRFPQQIARIDTLLRDEVPQAIQEQIIRYLGNHLDGLSAILFSDYHTGLLSRSLIDALRQQAQARGIMVTADAQGQLEKYTACDVVKCNADDAQEYLGRSLSGDADFAEAAQQLLQQLKLRRAMVITRGAEGATYARMDGQTETCPAPAVSDVYDTVGAGDTSIAVLTLALTASIDEPDAVSLANIASGIVVRHVGNYSPSPEELRRAVNAMA